MNVQAPDGRTWKVGRRWFPRRPRLPRIGADSIAEAAFDDLAVFFLSLTVVLVVVAALILFNVVAIALELLIVLLLVLGGLFARVVLRRPWIVEARSANTLHEWRVTGWRASSRQVELVAEQLRSGAQIDAPRQHR